MTVSKDIVMWIIDHPALVTLATGPLMPFDLIT